MHVKIMNFNRLLWKLAAFVQMPRDLGAQKRNVFDIHEDLSTKSTKQLIKAVEFPKKSNIRNVLDVLIFTLLP